MNKKSYIVALIISSLALMSCQSKQKPVPFDDFKAEANNINDNTIHNYVDVIYDIKINGKHPTSIKYDERFRALKFDYESFNNVLVEHEVYNFTFDKTINRFVTEKNEENEATLLMSLRLNKDTVDSFNHIMERADLGSSIEGYVFKGSSVYFYLKPYTVSYIMNLEMNQYGYGVNTYLEINESIIFDECGFVSLVRITYTYLCKINKNKLKDYFKSYAKINMVDASNTKLVQTVTLEPYYHD